MPEVAGQNIKVADTTLIRLLKEAGHLFRNERIRHPYPFCYRTDTPLIYKAIPTWFVRVESMRDRLVALNDEIHWVPEYVGSRRFGNWLADARDWAVSRNRYWGSCIPIWECANGHVKCVGSIEELAELSGTRLNDLHKHFVDPVTFPCPECGGTDDQGARRSSTSGSSRGRCPTARCTIRSKIARTVRVDLSGPVHRRGPRPDPGLVLHPPCPRVRRCSIRRHSATVSSTA